MTTNTVTVVERGTLNTIVVGEDWTPPPGIEVIDLDSIPDGVGPGWRRGPGGTWLEPAPEPAPAPDRVDDLQAQVDELLLGSLETPTQEQVDELLLTTLDLSLEQAQQRAELDELILNSL